MYVITRRDLSPGDQACQAVHAAFEFAHQHPAVHRKWVDESNYLVLLAVDDEIQLEALLDKAFSRGIATTTCREPDLNDAITAIALEPGLTSQKLCASIPLAFRKEATV